MIKSLLISFSLATAIVPSIAVGFSFPEIDFCPLGGPPGWFNRMTGQHNQGYYPPQGMAPGYPPPIVPYGWQAPAMSPNPVYFQQYPSPARY